MKPAIRLAGAFALAVVAAWAGFRVYSARWAPPAEPGVRVPAGEASPPTASDAELPPETSPAIKIPGQLPSFTLTDRFGKATPIESWPGKSLVINFWATWCAPCQREIPLLKTVAAEWSGRQFEVIGIAVDHRDKVQRFADQFGIRYPILIGEQDALDAAAALGVESPAFPFTVFTDRRGRVVTLFLGELHPAQAQLILAAVQRLNEDRADLPTTQHAISAGLESLLADPPG